MATIHIERARMSWMDRARSYKVHVDGEQVGEIANGGSLVVDVPDGTHEVQLRIDWCSSPVVRVEATSRTPVFLHCRPAANPLTALWYATVGARQYIRLAPADAAPQAKLATGLATSGG